VAAVTAPVRRRSVASLAVGSVGAGVLAYVFFVVATRTLGAEDAAAVSVLWTWWSLTAAAVTFPLQHWIVRTVQATGGERAVRDALPRLGVLVGAVALVSGLVSWVAGERLFGPGGSAFPPLVAVVTVGAGLLGVVRGHLTARDRLSSVGLNLVLENGVRSVAALGLAVAGYAEPWAFGVALVLGYGVALANLRAVLTWEDTGSVDEVGPVGAVGSTGLGQLLAQVALTGAPVVLALRGGRPEDVTALFAGLALFRAPYTVATALMASVTGRLTRLWLEGSSASWRRLELVVAGAVTAGALIAALLGGWAGPWVVRLVFGRDVVLDAAPAGLLAAGTVLALGNLVLAVALVAQGRGPALVRGWAAGGVAGLVWVPAAPLSPLVEVAWLFVVVEGAALLWLAVEEVRGRSGSAAA
jgi:O-antigen/teichoic acid export membrane protein